jgi:hypothetical protein
VLTQAPCIRESTLKSGSPNDNFLESGIRLILEELRDLRLEMRADRRRADEERRRADKERRRADAERRQSDERFERIRRDFGQDAARRDAATQRAFKDIRTVGLSIVKTLNHRTRVLERIDRRLGAQGDGRPEDGGGARPRR